jgi:DNA mismatch repair protein MutS
MDEIGRGTSTFDGLSLAWACAVELAKNIQPYGLFATHYFELTQLDSLYASVRNVHCDALEHQDKIVFMHRVKQGPANKSYGLQVAALAGLPPSVLSEAKEKLQQLEAQTLEPCANAHPMKEAAKNNQPETPITSEMTQFDLFAQSPLEEALRKASLDSMTPKQALDWLYDWQAKLKN